MWMQIGETVATWAYLYWMQIVEPGAGLAYFYWRDHNFAIYGYKENKIHLTAYALPIQRKLQMFKKIKTEDMLID